MTVVTVVTLVTVVTVVTVVTIVTIVTVVTKEIFKQETFEVKRGRRKNVMNLKI